MFRLVVSFIFLFFSFISYGQLQVNQTDAGGRKQGFWRKTDSLGRTIYEGKFVDGIPSDTFRYYYPNGALKMISVLSHKGKRASAVSYFPGGGKMASGNYFNEKRDSLWQFFNEFTGKLVSEEYYINGYIEGKSKVFFLEGGVSEITTYVHGIKEGLWEKFYPEGNIMSRGNYQAGEKQGRYQLFYPSGLVQYSGQYIQGHMDGVWTISDEKGKIIKKEVYSMGKLLNPEPPPKN